MSRMTLDHYALDPQAAVAGGDPYVLCEPGWPINVNELVFCPEGPATVAQLLEALGRPGLTPLSPMRCSTPSLGKFCRIRGK
jgi:hypothetical protein